VCDEKGRSLLTGDVPLRLDVFMEVWLDEAEPLFDATFDVSATFTYITEDCLVSHDLQCRESATHVV